MDKLASRLRRDADKIEVAVSDELDSRIAASLRSVNPQTEPSPAAESRRPALFWWASSFTGVAAAAAVIIIVNSQSAPETPVPTPAEIIAAVPAIDWNAESAVYTGPLQQELLDLQSDIRKAEQKVRDDIGL